MAEDQRSPRAEKIDIRPAVHVRDPASLGLRNEEGIAADTPEGAHGAVDATRDQTLGLSEERSRVGCHEVGSSFRLFPLDGEEIALLGIPAKRSCIGHPPL